MGSDFVDGGPGYDTATVKLKASKKVARKLRRMKSAKGTVKITVKQAGKTSTIKRKVTIKR